LQKIHTSWHTHPDTDTHTQTLNYDRSWATVAWFIADGASTQLLTFAQVVKLKAQETNTQQFMPKEFKTHVRALSQSLMRLWFIPIKGIRLSEKAK